MLKRLFAVVVAVLASVSVASAGYEFNGRYIADDGAEIVIAGPKNVKAMGPDRGGISIRPIYMVFKAKFNKKKRSAVLTIERLGKGTGVFENGGLRVVWAGSGTVFYRKVGVVAESHSAAGDPTATQPPLDYAKMNEIAELRRLLQAINSNETAFGARWGGYVLSVPVPVEPVSDYSNGFGVLGFSPMGKKPHLRLCVAKGELSSSELRSVEAALSKCTTTTQSGNPQPKPITQKTTGVDFTAIGASPRDNYYLLLEEGAGDAEIVDLTSAARSATMAGEPSAGINGVYFGDDGNMITIKGDEVVVQVNPEGKEVAPIYFVFESKIDKSSKTIWLKTEGLGEGNGHYDKNGLRITWESGKSALYVR